AESLAFARAQWLAAREPYLPTEAFRFYDGPIDDPERGVEGMVNAWPLDEAYIDYVEGDPDAGIVNDPSVPIDADTLMELNEQGGEENVATGYHAIEFLLWGQDLDPAGAGHRPPTDYVIGPEGTASNTERRAAYLRTVTSLLVDHLRYVERAWHPDDPDNYRSAFVDAPPEASLQKILTGLIVLAGFEMAGERLQAALDSGNQEDEHSCFSDNTHRDMVRDVYGIGAIWRGRYERIDGRVVEGTGLEEVVAEADPDLAARIDAQLETCEQHAAALVPPFDQEIALDNPEGRARVAGLIDALWQLKGLLQEAYRVLDLPSAPPA
ncbi:MAG: iron-regulated protein, partial [Deltaproteobacteria bacterium]